MLHIKTQLRRLLDRVELRFVRSRPGSVLILVVALLVLMAMLGTAYLVTAHNDSAASRLYEHNVQIDMLMDGLVNLAQLSVSDQPVPAAGVTTAPPSFQIAPFQPVAANPPPAIYPQSPIGVQGPKPLAPIGLLYPQPAPSVPASPANYMYWPLPNMQPGYYTHYDDYMATGPWSVAGTPPVTSTPAFPGVVAGGSFYFPNGAGKPPLTALSTGLGANKTWLAARYPVQVTGSSSESYGLDAAATYPSATAYTYVNPLFLTPNPTLNGLTPPALISGQPGLGQWDYWQGMTYPKGVIITQGSGSYYINTADNNPLPPLTTTNASGQYIPGAGALNVGWVAITPTNPSMPSPPVTPVTPQCMWPAVSAPLLAGATFEDPRYFYLLDPLDTRYVSTTPVTSPPQIVVRPDGARTHVIPAYVTINGINYPGLTYFSLIHNKWETAMAASASGDGIADSFLWRLPISAADGITYYAAVRIIDNNSAINVNTANSQTTEFDGLGNDTVGNDAGFQVGMFPTGIGLDTLLTTFPGYNGTTIKSPPYTDVYLGTELAGLNQYRLNNWNAYQSGGSYGRPGGIYVNPMSSVINTPYDENLSSRQDYLYRNLGDALWHGIGSRVSSPGYAYNTATGSITKLLSFDWSAAAAMAYKFDLVNANATQSTLETILAPSTLTPQGAPADPSVPWNPSQTSTWYATNVQEGVCNNRRAFLTTHNPTSNLMPVHSLYNMIWPGDPNGFAHSIPLATVAPGATAYTPPSFYTQTGAYTPTPATLPFTALLIQQNQNLQAIMAGGNGLNTVPTPNLSKYLTILNPLNDPSAPANVVPPTPRVSLNTADITAQDPPFVTTVLSAGALPAGSFPPTNNLNIPATYLNGAGTPVAWPIKGPSLWLGFYNAMIDAVAPNYIPPNITNGNPPVPSPYLNGQLQHFLPGIQAAVTSPSKFQSAAPRLGQFRSPLRDANFIPQVPAGPSGPLPTTPPTGTPNANNYMDANQVVLLRSLIAAVNEKDLRDSDDNVTHVEAAIPSLVPATTPNTPVLAAFINSSSGTNYSLIDAHVYGIEKQPFITEVYVNTEIAPPITIGGTARVNPAKTKNPYGYVGIQLYNPYDFPIDISNWTLGVMNRGTGVGGASYAPGATPGMVMKCISGFKGFPAGTSIGSKGYLLVENFNAGGAKDATYRPFASYPTGSGIGTAVPFPVSNLSEVLTIDGQETTTGGELYLLRQLPATSITSGPAALNALPPVPAFPGGLATPPTSPTPFSYAQLTQLAPVDTFDFTGMTLPQTITNVPPTQIVAAAFHYVRSTGQIPPAPLGASPTAAQITAYNAALAAYAVSTWRFVYPGRWDATKYWVTPPTGVTAPSVSGSKSYAVKVAPGNAPGNYAFQLRQEGIAVSTWNTTITPLTTQYAYDVWNATAPGTAGANNGNQPSVLFQHANPDSPVFGAPLFWQTVYGSANYYYGVPISFGMASAKSSYVNNFPAIQLNNTDFGGPSKVNTYNKTGTTKLMFPFGGFARVGDVLQVPYIGSYMILAPPSVTGLQPTANAIIYEINPVTTDSSLADDNDTDQVRGTDLAGDAELVLPSNDPIEQIGRFCPLSAADPLNQVFHPFPVSPATTTNALPMQDTYAWASHIFDYFTAIGNPHDDWEPGVDPNLYPSGLWDANPSSGTYHTFPGGTNLLQSSVPVPQSNVAIGSADSGNEDMAPVEGLININTASWPVFQRVPWGSLSVGLGGSSLANSLQAYQNIARDIAQYRNTYGPFKTLFDLNKVPMNNVNISIPPSGNAPVCFQQLYGDPSAADYGQLSGDLSPIALLVPGSNPAIYYPHPGAVGPTNSPTTDYVTSDFETRFGMIIRMSNILTTRSDTFTAYLLIQGYSGAGTPTPTLVVQRRSAMIIDRTTLNGVSGTTLNITPVPTN